MNNAEAIGGDSIFADDCQSSALIEFTTSDRVAHPVRFWAGADKEPVAIYLHGIEGHGLWFAGTAAQLSSKGISVYAPDRRGAGLSKQTSGDAKSYSRLVDDIGEMVDEIVRRHKGSPIFLIGNCWGGKVAVTLAARKTGSLIKGLVLTSPAVATQVDVPFATKLKIALCYFLGLTRYFDIPLTPENFTDNPPYLKYVADDPLRLKRATARFFVNSILLTLACRLAARKLSQPVLVLQSGRDSIVQFDGLKRWFESIGSADKTLKIFTTAAHSLDFEADQTEYQGSLANWIKEKSSSLPKAQVSQ